MSKDSTVIGNILFQKGYNFYKLNKTDSAFYYIQKSLTYPAKEFNLSNRNLLMGDIYYDLNNYESASLHAKKALSYPLGFYTKRECYRLLANIASHNDNDNLFDEYLKKYHAAQDSIIKYETDNDVVVLENLHQVNRQNKRVRTNFYAVAILFIILFICGFYIFRKYNKQNKEKEKTLVNEKQKSDFEIIRQQLIFKIKEEKIKTASKNKSENTVNTAEHLKIIYDKYLYFNDDDKFIKNMDYLYNDIASDIKENYPLVNNKELKYLMMLLLDCPTSDINFVLDYVSHSVHKMRWRLASKLKLSSATQIGEFLNSYL